MTYRVKLCSACPYLNELSAHHDPDAAHYACITCPADDVAPKIIGIYPRRRAQRLRVSGQADALQVSHPLIAIQSRHVLP